jgi:hypothetical protein
MYQQIISPKRARIQTHELTPSKIEISLEHPGIPYGDYHAKVVLLFEEKAYFLGIPPKYYPKRLAPIKSPRRVGISIPLGGITEIQYCHPKREARRKARIKETYHSLVTAIKKGLYTLHHYNDGQLELRLTSNKLIKKDKKTK